MTGILAFAAKRTVVDVLAAAFAISDPAVRVTYAYEQDPPERAIWLGGVTGVQDNETAEVNLLIRETDQVTVVLRVYRAEDAVRAAEVDMETLAGAVCDTIAAHARDLGTLSLMDTTSFVLDDPASYAQPESGTVVQARILVTVWGDLT